MSLFAEISVILPVYNGGDYLKLSVESVLAQTEADFEFLVLDDCSTDGSREYLQGIKDVRFKLFTNDVNKGLFYNLNFLIQQSKAPLIKLWAQDDIMNPGCLEAFVTFNRKHPGLGFSYCSREVIDENGQVTAGMKADITPPVVSTALHNHIAWFTGSIAGNISNVCLSRSAVNEVGLFNEEMKISGDFDMQARLAQKFRTGFIYQPLIKLRNHSGQLSRDDRYYFLHAKEDIAIYRFILNGLSSSEKTTAKKALRKYKLVFYYTLMVKALLQGRLKLFGDYFKLLRSFDNMCALSIQYFSIKVLGKKYPYSIPEELLVKEAK